MKKLLYLLPFIFFACNSEPKPESREMKFAAVLPSGEKYDLLANGDTLFYKTKDTSVAVPYTYKVSYTEIHPKGSTPPVNQPPTARAGNDQTITLPVSSVQLNANGSTDPEGAALKFYWRQTAGPSKATMIDTNKAVCTASSLKEGTYTFELRAVDPLNAFTADFVNVTVKPEVVTPPVGSIIPFNLTKNTAFKLRHFAGFEDWNGQNYTSFGGFKDKYFRFVVSDFLKGSGPTISWTRFDQEANKAFSVGGKFSFAVFMVNDSDDFLASETFGGAKARYPIAWQNQMMAESTKPFIRNGMWIPNWNSPSVLNNIDKLLKDIYNHIVEKGWKDRINYTDIRIYGQWGEWHNGGLFDNMNQYPSGTRPTVATYKRWIDAHINAFPDWPLVCLFAAYDANWLPHTYTPNEVTYYALTAKNKWGLIGWRRDNWGITDDYPHDYLERNTRSYNGVVFNSLIMERWKYAPVVGEPFGPGANLSDLPNQVKFYHAASIGNGNYTANNSSMELFRQAEANAGYKIALTGGQAEISTASDLTIKLSVENFGNAPCYESYDIVYQLKSGSTVVWSGTSTWTPLLKIPGTYSISDKFRPGHTGTFTLNVVIKNSYRSMPLFNTGQGSDGGLQLATGIKLVYE